VWEAAAPPRCAESLWLSGRENAFIKVFLGREGSSFAPKENRVGRIAGCRKGEAFPHSKRQSRRTLRERQTVIWTSLVCDRRYFGTPPHPLPACGERVGFRRRKTTGPLLKGEGYDSRWAEDLTIKPVPAAIAQAPARRKLRALCAPGRPVRMASATVRRRHRECRGGRLLFPYSPTCK